MKVGFIYKITSCEQNTGRNRDPEACYIGQTRRQYIYLRWSGHKAGAKKWDKKRNENKKREDRHAKLYQAICFFGPDNLKIEELEKVEASDTSALQRKLDQLENYYIDFFDSIEKGWNKVRPPLIRTPNVTPSNETLADIAKDKNISYSSLRHRIIKMGEDLESAVRHLQNLKQEPCDRYEFGRQLYEHIGKLAESKIHNKYQIPRKTIEVRIRKLKNSNELPSKFDKNLNAKIWVLPEEIFAATREQEEYSVEIPTGETLKGTIIQLHATLLDLYPDKVNPNYTTVQSRLTQKNWTPEQAFGLAVPPNYTEADRLVTQEGYRYVPKAPTEHSNTKPVILHSTKEVFVSQGEFAKTYKIAEDLVSDHLVSGKTAEEVLDYYDLKP